MDQNMRSAGSAARAARAPAVSSATYWRRRGVALATALAVLTSLTWAVNMALSGGRASSQAAARSVGTSTVSRHPRGGASHPSPGPPAGQPAVNAPARVPHGHQHSLAGEIVDLGSQPSATPHPTASSSPPSNAPAPGSGRHACSLGALVLTLRSAQNQYGSGQTASFAVDALSTASRPCGFNLGGRFISVVVDSAGTPLWDSASCVRGTGSQLVTLRRGVPASLRVTWDRRTSLSGCSGQGIAAPPGQYTVAVFDAQLRSKSVTFELSGRSPAAH